MVTDPTHRRESSEAIDAVLLSPTLNNYPCREPAVRLDPVDSARADNGIAGGNRGEGNEVGHFMTVEAVELLAHGFLPLGCVR